MALSLRDVMVRPSDVEAMELLMDEYNKYCIGELDNESDVSVEEEDVRNDRDFNRFPVVSGAFNVRSLSRPEFPRTWIVPKGTIPPSCYANAVSHGGTNMALLVDYSQTRCVVCVRSELLRPPADGVGGLPQKVLAVWPEERNKSHPLSVRLHNTEFHGNGRLPMAPSAPSADLTSIRTSKNVSDVRRDSVLYWPAYVTRVIGVFEDKLFDMTPESQVQLQAYDNFEEILVMALRSPMRVCVDVTFCIDEVSEAHRLTVAPAIRYQSSAVHAYRVGSRGGHAKSGIGNSRKDMSPSKIIKSNGVNGGITSTLYDGHHHCKISSNNNRDSEEEEEEEEDPEVVSASELISRTMKKDTTRHRIVTKSSHCPLLTPDVVPQVLSIRNYSYTAVASRCRRSVTHVVNGTAQSMRQHCHFQNDDPRASSPNSQRPRVSQSLISSGGTSPPSRTIASKAKLNKNTLSHAPIALNDMLAGPICQAKQFVFLRPSTSLVIAAQRSAIEELRVIWLRLRKALVEPPMPPIPSCASSFYSSPPRITLHASEVQLPRLFATECAPSWKTTLAVQYPDLRLYKSPRVKDPSLSLERLRLPEPRRSQCNPTLCELGVELTLHILQGHRMGPGAAERESSFPPTLPPPCESSGQKVRHKSEWYKGGRDESFATSSTHAPGVDTYTRSMSLDPVEVRKGDGSVVGLASELSRHNTHQWVGSYSHKKMATIRSPSELSPSPRNSLPGKRSPSGKSPISPPSINACASVFLSNTRRSTSSLQTSKEARRSKSTGNTEHRAKSAGVVVPAQRSGVESHWAVRCDAAEAYTKRKLFEGEGRECQKSTEDDLNPTLCSSSYQDAVPQCQSLKQRHGEKPRGEVSHAKSTRTSTGVATLVKLNAEGTPESSMVSTMPPHSVCAAVTPCVPQTMEEVHKSESLCRQCASPQVCIMCPRGDTLSQERATAPSRLSGDAVFISSMQHMSTPSSSSRRNPSRDRRPYNRLGTFVELLSDAQGSASDSSEARSALEEPKLHVQRARPHSPDALRQSSGSGTRSSSRAYSFVSWRHASGVEVDLDDPSLLPPAVGAETRAKERGSRQIHSSHGRAVASSAVGSESPSPVKGFQTWRRSGSRR